MEINSRPPNKYSRLDPEKELPTEDMEKISSVYFSSRIM